jgi:hypothetical protein
MSEAPENEVVTETDEAPAPSPEELASKRGWRPKEEWAGDPEKWVDAETFVKRGEEEPALMRKELQAANRKIASMERSMERFSAHHNKTEERMYQRALAEIEGRLEKAALAQDVAAVRQATKDLVDLNAEASGSPIAAPVNEDFEAWKAEHTWFGKDKAMTAATQAIADEVFAEGFTGKAQLAEVTTIPTSRGREGHVRRLRQARGFTRDRYVKDYFAS